MKFSLKIDVVFQENIISLDFKPLPLFAICRTALYSGAGAVLFQDKSSVATPEQARLDELWTF
jgi:hypothetical protein